MTRVIGSNQGQQPEWFNAFNGNVQLWDENRSIVSERDIYIGHWIKNVAVIHLGVAFLVRLL